MTSVHSLTLALLLLHFLGDYPLQSEALARQKKEKLTALLAHFAIHALLLLLCLPGAARGGSLGYIWRTLLAVWGSHVALDLLKTWISKRCHHKEPLFYLLDQALHVAVILLAGELLFPLNSFQWRALIPQNVFQWLLLLVLISKPANVTFKTMFQKYQFTDPETQSVTGAGALIGTMERILSAIFLASGQVAAIGLIYTAKSIARFKQIEENKQFAEYYLIGTLYSILYVTLAYYLVLVF